MKGWICLKICHCRVLTCTIVLTLLFIGSGNLCAQDVIVLPPASGSDASAASKSDGVLPLFVETAPVAEQPLQDQAPLAPSTTVPLLARAPAVLPTAGVAQPTNSLKTDVSVQAQNRKYTQCIVDTDCVLVRDDCGMYIAINSKSRQPVPRDVSLCMNKNAGALLTGARGSFGRNYTPLCNSGSCIIKIGASDSDR